MTTWEQAFKQHQALRRLPERSPAEPPRGLNQLLVTVICCRRIVSAASKDGVIEAVCAKAHMTGGAGATAIRFVYSRTVFDMRLDAAARTSVEDSNCKRPPTGSGALNGEPAPGPTRRY